MEKYNSVFEEDYEVDEVLTGKVIDYFLANPYPNDDDIHDFADELGVSHDKLEEIIYSLLTDFILNEDEEGYEEE